jgi:hypothetical protein
MMLDNPSSPELRDFQSLLRYVSLADFLRIRAAPSGF